MRHGGTAGNAPVSSTVCVCVCQFVSLCRHIFFGVFCVYMPVCLAVFLRVFWLPALCAAPAVTDGVQPTPRLTDPH